MNPVFDALRTSPPMRLAGAAHVAATGTGDELDATAVADQDG
jgi:hypothetical protein